MLDADTLRFVLGLLLLLPLSFILKIIPSVPMRRLYSSIAGMLVQLWVYRWYMVPLYLQHLVVFAIIKIKGRKCGSLVTFQAMLALSAYHIYEYYTNYGGWVMNASALLMILVCKYSLLAYNFQDGGQEQGKLTAQQKKNRIIDQIDFLEFMGYVNFLPTSIVGPPLEFNDYKNYIQQKQVYVNVASVWVIFMKTLGETFLYGILHLIGALYLPVSTLKTSSFYSQPLWYIFIYSTISIYLIRCKYYFAWKLSMSSIHISGVSFNGKDKFDRINTVNPWVVESSIHIRDKINNWNIGVQQWLRKCIYQRSPINNKTVNQLYVFIVSAFWHGFYSAYYISEALWFVQLYLQTLMFKYFSSNQEGILKRMYKSAGKIGQVLLALLVSFQFTHNSTYFVILEGEYCWKFMQRLYFVPEIGLFVMILIFSLLPKGKGKEKKEKYVKKEVKEEVKEGKEEAKEVRKED